MVRRKSRHTELSVGSRPKPASSPIFKSYAFLIGAWRQMVDLLDDPERIGVNATAFRYV